MARVESCSPYAALSTVVWVHVHYLLAKDAMDIKRSKAATITQMSPTEVNSLCIYVR